MDNTQEVKYAVCKLVKAFCNLKDSDEGMIARAAEYNNWSNDTAALEIINSSDIYELITDELIDEVCDVVAAILNADMQGEVYADLPIRAEYNDLAKEHYAKLNNFLNNFDTEMHNALDSAWFKGKEDAERRQRQERQEEIERRLAKLSTGKNHIAEYMLEDTMAQKEHEYKL